jgi:two-component system sensor histidine kinase PhoQ
LKIGIQSRLLLTTALVLGTLLSLAGLVLERTFRGSVLGGAEEQLRLVTFSLMGALDTTGGGLRVPDPLPEPRLAQPGSGLYASVTDSARRLHWQSPSSRALDPGADRPPGGNMLGLPDAGPLAPGQFDFHAAAADPAQRLHLRYAVIWEDLEDTVLTFHVAVDRGPFQAVIQDFRRRLLLGLGAATVLFAVAQVLAVRWGLRPLRNMAQQVRELEEGRRDRLGIAYPDELAGLAENLDRFVVHEEGRRRRYRKAMEDLAHSLKTPLAVMRNAVEEVPERTRGLFTDQLDRMQNSVMHQLSRAAVSGPVLVGRSELLEPLLQRLLRALEIAYRERNIAVAMDIGAGLRIRGDERDLMELLGNVMENAFKYTHARIRITARRVGSLTLCVDDDGPGLVPPLRAEMLKRGMRADEVQPGQGLGLAVVAELVQLYGGRLQLEPSDLGGLRVRIELP